MAEVTISFDNGPDAGVTPLVLDVLARRGIRGLFFPVGENLLRPGAVDLMRRAAAEGHRIGNHTFTHPRPFGALPPAQAIEEIDRTDALLDGLTEPDRMFRPSAGGGALRPGVLTPGIVDHLVATGHTLVLWSVAARVLSTLPVSVSVVVGLVTIFPKCCVQPTVIRTDQTISSVGWAFGS